MTILRITLWTTIATMAFVSSRSYGQCSDAGVCSIGGPEKPDHIIVLTGGLSYGASVDDTLSFVDIDIGLQATLAEDLSVIASLPIRSIDGPLGTTSGIGDLLLVARYGLWTNSEISISAEGGARFATGAVNEGGLPQAYQPGLGTTDALLGVSAAGERWTLSAGFQYAPGRSNNRVNRLRRGSDVSVRGTYTVFDDGPSVRGEVILIHKLEESDGYYLKTSSSSYSFVPGGSGIPKTDRTQINLVGNFSYPVGVGMSIQVRAAMALLARPVNVDGLKRNFTLQAGVSLPLK